MKKNLLMLVICILLIHTAVFAKTVNPSAQTGFEELIESAVLVEGTQKPDIYNVPDLSKDIENTEFEIRESAKLFSGEETAEFVTCADYLTLEDGVLSGTVTAYVNNLKNVDGTMYLAVYDGDILKNVLSKPFKAEAGSRTCDFDDINTGMTSGNYSLKMFLWDSGTKPLAKPYTYTYYGEAAVFADGTEITPDVPTMVMGDSILADVNVFSGIGAQLEYDSENDVIWVRKNNVEIGMYIGDNRIYVFKGSGNYAVDAEYNSFVSGGSIYVPVTDICEVFGFEAVNEEKSKAVKLFSNEILEASHSVKFDAESESSSHYDSIPVSDFYSAHINNGLTYFTALGSNYIYVTNGSQSIKYAVGSRPNYILSEGDYIYFTVWDSERTVKRINKNTSKIEKLFSMSYFDGDFTYYNGELYLEEKGKIYNIAENSFEAYDRYGDFDDVWIFILDRNTICHAYVEQVSAGSNITLKIIDRRTNTVISSESFYQKTDAAIEYRDVYGYHIGDSLYLDIHDWPFGTYTKYIQVSLDGNNIESVSNITLAERSAAWRAEEPNTQSNFSTTRVSTAYRFWQDGNIIVATDRATGENIQLMDLSKRCNKLLFADDNCFIHVVYGIGYVEQDGRTYCRYTGESYLYMNYYDGSSVRLFSTYSY